MGEGSQVRSGIFVDSAYGHKGTDSGAGVYHKKGVVEAQHKYYGG